MSQRFFKEHIQIFIFDLILAEWYYNVLHKSAQCHDAFNQSSIAPGDRTITNLTYSIM